MRKSNNQTKKRNYKFTIRIICILLILCPIVFGKSLNIKDDSDTFLFVNSSIGNVGIGTVNPTYKLEVVGNVSLNNTLFVKENGNVGIGTTTPAHKLHVIGNVNITGSFNATRIEANEILVNGAVVNRSIDLSTYNSSVDLSTYNFSVSLDNYNQSISLIDYLTKVGQINSTAWNRSGTNVILSNTGDNVGIGITSPSLPLDIMEDTDGTNMSIRLTHPNSNSAVGELMGGIQWFNEDESSGADQLLAALKVISTDSLGRAGRLGIFTASGDTTEAERISILNNGNVGIGTTSPDYTLDINTTSDNNFQVVGRGTGYGGTLLANIYSERSSGGVGGNAILKVGSAYAPNLLFVDDIGAVGINDTAPRETLDVTGTFHVVTGSGTESIFADSSGNVGIGTTSPDSLLEIDGTGALLNVTNGASTYLFVEANNGRVGIGTPNPQASLDTDVIRIGRGAGSNAEYMDINVGDRRARFHIVQDELSGTAGGFQFDLGGALNGVSDAFLISQNSDLAIEPSNVVFMVTGDGNVGIGTVSPDFNLEIETTSTTENVTLALTRPSGGKSNKIVFRQTGNSIFEIIGEGGGLRFYDASVGGENEIMFMDTVGEVGIGTTSPDTTLDLLDSSGVSIRMANVDGNYWEIARSATDGDLEIIDDSLGTVFLIDQDTGNVGIGTTSPQYLLQVANVTNAVNLSGVLYINGSNGGVSIGTSGTRFNANLYIRGEGADHIILEESVSGKQFNLNVIDDTIDYFSIGEAGVAHRLVVQTGGNVGIGTTSPDDILHLKRTGTPILRIQGTSSPQLILQNDNYQNWTITSRDTTGQLEILHGGIERFVIENGTGNVGIGTASPDDNLFLIGNATFAPSTGSGAGESHLKIRMTGTGDGSPNSIIIGANGTKFAGVAFIDTSTAGVAATTPLVFRISQSEKMRIHTDGNVGIGTTNPLEALHIVENSDNKGIVLERTSATTGVYDIGIASDGDLQIGERDVGSIMTFEKTTGNVGIGTTSPDTLLDVESSGTPILTVQTSATSSQEATIRIRGARTTSSTSDISNLEFWNDESGGEFIMAEIATRNADGTSGTNNSDLIFRTTNGSSLVEVMRIDDAGKVGIGTSSPEGELHVDGVIIVEEGSTKGFGFRRNAASNQIVLQLDKTGEDEVSLINPLGNDLKLGTNDAVRMTIDNTGNVGIGTTSPKQLLHVNKTQATTYPTIALFQSYDITSGTNLRQEIKFAPNGNYFKTFITGSSTDFLIVDQDNNDARLSFLVQGSAGNIDSLAVTSSGKVGIGTATPTHTLNVVGATNLSGALILKVLTVTSTSDINDLDVSGIGVFLYDGTTTVRINGFSGGVMGQILHIVRKRDTSDIRLYQDDPSGTQKIFGPSSPYTSVGLDGATLIYTGDFWRFTAD